MRDVVRKYMPAPKSNAMWGRLGQPPSKILLHTFSNSGGINLVAMAEVYQELYGPEAFLPHQLLILDSTPGGHLLWEEIGRWSTGIAVGLASHVPLPQAILQMLAYVWCVGAIAVPALFGYKNVAERVKEVLNDPGVLDKKPQRLFLYSKQDQLIGYRDVQEYAAKNSARGFRVQLMQFDNSSHCQHARVHPFEYWNTVKETWDAIPGVRETPT